MSHPVPDRIPISAFSQRYVTQAPFGRLPDDTPVEVFTLCNCHGLELRVITYGAIIVSLVVPDRTGAMDDVVLGHDTLDGYVKRNWPYFGAVLGRYGNRIANGQFQVDGRTYAVATNDGPNHLHGGIRGFDKVMWEGEAQTADHSVGVALSRTSPDGEEGYPGTLVTRITYTLTDRNELIVDYHATTDKPTIVNLTQHSYFNLAGQGARDILEHELQINADCYIPVDTALIPTGEIAPVAGTPFDFRTPTSIGARIAADADQIRHAGGYDHTFVLRDRRETLRDAARVIEPVTGRTLDVATTEPGVQFYAGNVLNGAVSGKAGRSYGQRSGFCLETQHFPDSPNQPGFPSTIVRPDEEYRSRTVFTFGRAR